ncbi:MAG: RHS repeat-associated core domain-containing protein, partial [Sedimentisphaerales bacterium]|nr:RHS repeat-associated core domain-containing protein [Sedimentisphaerales bacterium]
SNKTDYQYTGQRKVDLGIYYYQARFYDAALGRFTQPDEIVPVGVQGIQAFDRFAYANNNSVRYIDPTGHALDSGCEYEGCGIDLEVILDEVPFDETFGGNIEHHHSSGNSNEEIDDLEESSNPPLEILVPINILLHATTIVVEGGIVYAEVQLLPFALATPVIGVPLELVLAGVGAVVLDVDVAFSSWVYRIYQNPQGKQKIEFLPPWGFDND